MKVLNLYAGIGGNRKLWENVDVTAVEIDQEIARIYQDFFPGDKVIVTDAHAFLLANFQKFDFIWSSPPCPTHSVLNLTKCFKSTYPDMRLYQEIIFLHYNFKGVWVVENVIPYYDPLIPAQKCGRHNYWCNFLLSNLNLRTPKSLVDMTKGDLMAWLDIHISKNIYINSNHCTRQILRNCVHPKLGLHVFNCAFKTKQETLGGDKQ